MQPLLDTGTWLGVGALYLAFAAAQGTAVRHAWAGKGIGPAVGALVIYLPATVLMLCYEPWPLAVRWISITLGTIALILSAWPPGAVRTWWQRSTALRYLASAMAISALVQAGQAWSSASAAAPVLALAAGLASLASLRGSLQQP